MACQHMEQERSRGTVNMDYSVACLIVGKVVVRERTWLVKTELNSQLGRKVFWMPEE